MSVPMFGLGLLWAISRSGFSSNTGRMVRAEALGETITKGFIGANGGINQPTYQKIMVRVAAPQTSIIYKTKKIKMSANGETYQFGVIKILKSDDGRRKYNIPSLGKGLNRVGNVFENLESPVGYATVEWNTMTNSITRSNNGIGRKGWFLRLSSSIIDEESAQTYADNLYNNMLANNEPTEPSEPEEPTVPLEPLLPSFEEDVEVPYVAVDLDTISVIDVDDVVIVNDPIGFQVEDDPDVVVDDVVLEVIDFNTNRGLNFNKFRGLGGL